MHLQKWRLATWRRVDCTNIRFGAWFTTGRKTNRPPSDRLLSNVSPISTARKTSPAQPPVCKWLDYTKHTHRTGIWGMPVGALECRLTRQVPSRSIGQEKEANVVTFKVLHQRPIDFTDAGHLSHHLWCWIILIES